MSDVVVSTTASTTVVTTSSTAVNVAVTTYPVSVSASSVGLQGATGATGATGAQGSAGVPGASGVISVSSPITNSGSSSSAILGLDQASLSLTKSQISDFTSGTVASAGTAQQAGTATYATTAGTASYATTSGTAVYGTTSGTASYATLAGTSIGVSGSAITRSQISDFTSGTVAVATSASTATTAGTASYATTSGTAVYATTSGTATYATSAGTVTGAAYTNTANLFTVGQVVQTGSATNTAVTVRGAASQTTDLLQYQTSASAVLGGVSPIGQIYAGSTSVLTAGTAGSGFAATALTSAAYTSATVAVFTYPLTVQVVSVGQKVAVTGVTGGAYNGVWTVTAIGGSSGAYTFTVLGSGFTNNAGTGGFFSVSAAVSITANSQLTVPLIIQAAASQTARLIEFQNSSGTALANIQANGSFNATGLSTTFGLTISGAAAPLTTGGTAGTSGQVLTSQGTGVSPAWTTISSGGNYGSIPKTGYYYTQTGYDVFNSTTINTSAGVSYAVPFYLGASTTATRLMLQVSTAAASSTARLGIYSNASGGDYPGTLLLDAGAVATTTTGFKQITISQALSAGVYWLSIQRTDTGAGAVNYLGADGLNSDMNPSLSMPMTSIASPANAGNILGWKQTGAGTAFQTTWAGTGLAAQVPVIWIGF